jgi:hypothetical protein
MSEDGDKKRERPSIDELLEQTLEELATVTKRYDEEQRWKGYYKTWYEEARKRLKELEANEKDPTKFWCGTCKAFHQLTCIK